MSANDVSSKVEPSHTQVKSTRREILIALGLGATAPLFVACGGGGGGGAAASAPSAATPPPTPPPTPPTPPTPPALDITPTVTFDATATSGLTINNAYLTSSSAVNPAFTFSGAALSLITQFGPAVPRASMVSAADSNADTFAEGTVYTTFYHTGTMLDVMQYGFSDNVMLYINDTFIARYGYALVTGTAQSGATNTITLAAGSSAVSGYYNEYYVR